MRLSQKQLFKLLFSGALITACGAIHAQSVITTCAELNAMRSGNDYVLGNDLDCSDYHYTTIAGVFQGTLDGNDHTISNLTIHRARSNRSGLFDGISDATIQNIHFENVNIPVNFDGSKADQGLIAGAVFYYGENTISNIKVSGLQIGNQNAAGFTGGIIGRIPGATLTLSDIHINNASMRNNFGSAGGLIGLSSGHVRIIDSSVHALTSINANHDCGKWFESNDPDEDEPTYHFYNRCSFGGLIGDVAAGTVEVARSSATGNIINTLYAGGMIGIASGEIYISDSYTLMAVAAEKSAGGIVGGATNKTTTLTHVYTAGAVKLWGLEYSGHAVIGSGSKHLAGIESYFDKQSSLSAHSGDDFSTGLTTAEIQASPSNFNFKFGLWEPIFWKFEEGAYPSLIIAQ